MNIRPLHDLILVKRIKAETQTESGLYIPPTAQERPTEAEVIAVGSGKLLDDGTVRALDVKVGDTILFGKYAGGEVLVGGEPHLILREDDIMGVVEA